MSMNMETATNRVTRLAILTLIKPEYPGAVDVRALTFALEQVGYMVTDATLSAHLRYLEEKGYTRLEKRAGAGFDIAFVSLTAEGWDLLDGLTEAAGIEAR